MSKIKSYTNVWSIEKTLYSINDFELPFPVTITQMAWFVITFMIILVFRNVPPLSMIEADLVKYLGVPVVVTWVMCSKSFDGKKPLGFLKSVIKYLFRPKITYAGKEVRFGKQKCNEAITVVRSEIKIGISD